MHQSSQLRAEEQPQGFQPARWQKKKEKNELKQQNEKQAWLYNTIKQQLRPPKETKPRKENTHSVCTVNKVI